MFGSSALEVSIGIMFVFFTLSLLASAVSEMGAALLHRREKFLQGGIANLTGLGTADTSRAERLYAHPQIRELVRPGVPGRLRRGERLPAAIPAPVFASALLDVLASDALSDDPARPRALMDSLATLPVGHPLRNPIQRLVTTARQDIDAVRADLDAHRAAIESWFETAMHRVTDWYAVQVRWVLLACGIVLAVGLNVDAFAVAKGLWGDAGLRQAVVTAADRRVAGGNPAVATADVPGALAEVRALDQFALPIGWKFDGAAPSGNDPRRWPGMDWRDYPAKLLGLLVTALAVMLGAPFWFDLLSRVVNLRSTGRRSDGNEAPAPAAPPLAEVTAAVGVGVAVPLNGTNPVVTNGNGVLDVEEGEPLPDPIPV